jgi:bile acid:Na+ symporter, BASS family
MSWLTPILKRRIAHRESRALNSPLITFVLPCALAVIMFGLGLSLTAEDFRRVARHPKAVTVALLCQVVLLPAVAWGLIELFGLRPDLAMGFMLLAASPGGPMANLFSHLFKGDVALNISLTAINSIVALVSLPVIANLALDHFLGGGEAVGLQPAKVVQVFAVVLVPVVAGMFVRNRAIGFADRMDRPVRVASTAFLGLVILLAIVQERENVAGYIASVGLICLVFATISIVIGYVVPRLAGVRSSQAIASSFEVGIHNSTLAIVIAVSVLDSTAMAVPASVYVLTMWIPAFTFGFLMNAARRRDARAVAIASTAPSAASPSSAAG